MPSSWLEGKTRMAISLRVAARSLRKGRGGGSCASSGMVDPRVGGGRPPRQCPGHGERLYPRERTGRFPAGKGRGGEAAAEPGRAGSTKYSVRSTEFRGY